MTPIAIPRVARGHHGFEHHHQRIYLIDIALAPGSGCKKSDSQWRPPVFDYISKKSRSCRIYLGSMQMITNLPYAMAHLGGWTSMSYFDVEEQGTRGHHGIEWYWPSPRARWEAPMKSKNCNGKNAKSSDRPTNECMFNSISTMWYPTGVSRLNFTHPTEDLTTDISTTNPLESKVGLVKKTVHWGLGGI